MPRANGRNADGTLHHRGKVAQKRAVISSNVTETQFDRYACAADLVGIGKAELVRKAVDAYVTAIEKARKVTYDPMSKQYVSLRR